MSTRGGGIANVYKRAFGIVGPDESVLKSEGFKSPVGWSSDGRYFVYVASGQGGDFDIWAEPQSGERTPQRLLETPFNEAFVTISSDSQWLAYASNETGRYDIYVQSFPKGTIKQQVSIAGGIMPKWSADGRKLYFLAPDSTLNFVSIKPVGSSLEVGSPSLLFPVRVVGGGIYIGGQARNYDVSADGRFIIKLAGEEPASSPITLILNWASSLKK